MNDIEKYDRILGFMLDELGSGSGANNSQIKTKVFPELEDYQIQDLLQAMYKLQPAIFKLKEGNNGRALVISTEQWKRAKAFQRDGGFVASLEEKRQEQLTQPLPVQTVNVEGYFAQLHPSVLKAAAIPYAVQDYSGALRATGIALNEAVQAKTNLTEDGVALMQKSFRIDKPLLKFPKIKKGEFANVFAGYIAAVRNPVSHSSDQMYNQQHTLEWLSYASALFRLLDEAEPTTT